MAQDEKKLQKQMVYWDGVREYFIFTEGQVIAVSWQEANRLVFKEGWAAEMGYRPATNILGGT